MGEGQEQQYVAQLRDVFNSFDTSGCGSLSREELSDLCVSLHLQDAALNLIQILEQDGHTARVDFEQFKNALILVLSSAVEQPQVEQEPPRPEIQPKFVKGSKRYGRRSTPEFIEPVSDLGQFSPGPEKDQDESYESAVPCKRECQRWNAHEAVTGEEYEAEGQLHLWNPDEPSTPRGSLVSLSERGLEQRALEVCELLGLSWDGLANHNDLLALSERLGLEVPAEVLQTHGCGEGVTFQEFISKVLHHSKPPTPSASTPYRQLKRMHSTQPFDEGGRRISAPSALSSSISLRLFSTLDDGTGFTAVEQVLDSWTEEGIENSAEILQALNFSLEGKLSLSDLTVALENELLMSKSAVLQAALASFKTEIRHLIASADRELREKEKVQSDLEKAERLKTHLAAEVDEHHAAIEHMNKLNLRKLEQEHKEKLSSVRSELMKEMDLVQQAAAAQREELEAEIHKIREDETFLRDHLSISVKENRRLEMELLDTAEKLVEAENQVLKLQKNMDNIMKEKFGDLDPGSAEFFLQEERIKQLHLSYESQCRDLQDRIDELQSEINDFHNIGRVHPSSAKSLSEELELETQSPGNESDPGIGSEEVQPFSLSLEAEMMLERLKDRHLQEMDDIRSQLENKMSEFEEIVEKQKTSHEEQKKSLVQQHRQELQALRGEMSQVQTQAEELQTRLEQAQIDQSNMEQNRDKELETMQEEEIQTLRQQLLEAHIKNADLDEQLRSLEEQQSGVSDSFNKEIEEMRKNHAQEISNLVQTNDKEKCRLLTDFDREKDSLKVDFEGEMKTRLGQERERFEKEKEEIVQRLTEQWQKERTQLDEQNTDNLQVLLEEEMLKLVKEHDEKERKLKEQWEAERAQIQQTYEGNLIERLKHQTTEFEQREQKQREEWEREKAQLEEDFEGMVQEKVREEMEKTSAEREEEERRFERLVKEEMEKMEKRHRETVKSLTQRHREEREELSSALDKLKKDIALERSEASRLSEENFTLKQNIEALKEDDLKEMMKTLETLKKEKNASQKAADDFKKQISDLQSQSKLLENKNWILCEKNSQHLSDVETLRQQVTALMETKEKTPTQDKAQLSSCVSAVEAELKKAMSDMESLKQRNSLLTLEVTALREKMKSLNTLEQQLTDLLEEKKSVDKETQVLRNQLLKSQEKTKASDENLQAVALQSSRLKADVRVLQQQRESLQHEVTLLNKKLQNANEKSHVLERALHSTGVQSHSKKLLREELARLMEQDQKLLKQENDKLQAEMLSVKGELRQTRDKVRQLDGTVVNLKQQKQTLSSTLLDLKQEHLALKQELEAQKDKNKGREAGARLPDVEGLLQENAALKSQMARLSNQLIETFQAQLVGLLPGSPHRSPRGQREEAENLQGDRECKMKNMEERMREVEMSLHNVKLLLREKVLQLKEQLHKNGKADVLIKDLYSENNELLKALEVTEQRHKIAEKKNYLLEEKISSLTKILRDLGPSSLPALQYHFTCS